MHVLIPTVNMCYVVALIKTRTVGNSKNMHASYVSYRILPKHKKPQPGTGHWAWVFCTLVGAVWHERISQRADLQLSVVAFCC